MEKKNTALATNKRSDLGFSDDAKALFCKARAQLNAAYEVMTKGYISMAGAIRTIDSGELYKIGGYKNMLAMMETEYGMSKTTMYDLKAIAAFATAEITEENGKGTGEYVIKENFASAPFTSVREIAKLIPADRDKVIANLDDNWKQLSHKEFKQWIQATLNPAIDVDADEPAQGTQGGQEPAQGTQDGQEPAQGTRGGQEPAQGTQDGQEPAPEKEHEKACEKDREVAFKTKSPLSDMDWATYIKLMDTIHRGIVAQKSPDLSFDINGVSVKVKFVKVGKNGR